MDSTYEDADEVQQQIREETSTEIGLLSPPQTVPLNSSGRFVAQPIASQPYGPPAAELPNRRNLSSRRTTAPPNVEAAWKRRNDQFLAPYESALANWESYSRNEPFDEYQRQALADYIWRRGRRGESTDPSDISRLLFGWARDAGNATCEWDEAYEAWLNDPDRTTQPFLHHPRPDLGLTVWGRPPKPPIAPTNPIPIQATTAEPRATEEIRSIGSASLTESIASGTTFKGTKQPLERLEHVQNFLADEDFFRSMGFTSHIAEIEEYIAHFRETQPKMEKDVAQKLSSLEDMIRVHKDQIAKETDITSPGIKSPEYTYTSKGRIERPSQSTATSNLEYQEKTAKILKDTPLNFSRPAKRAMYETRLTAPISTQDRLEKEGDPYKYIKAVRDTKAKQNGTIRKFQTQERAIHHGDSSYFSAPEVDGPYLKVPKVIAEVGQVRRQRELIDIANSLIAIEPFARRMLLRNVILQIDVGLTDSNYMPQSPASITPEIYNNGSLNQGEVDLLARMCSLPGSSSYLPLVLPSSRARSTTETKRMEAELQAFATEIDALFQLRTDLYPDGNSHHPFTKLLSEVNSKKEANARYAVNDALVYRKAMLTAKRLRLSREFPGQIFKPRLHGDRFPEDEGIHGPPFSRDYNPTDGVYDADYSDPPLTGSAIERKAAQIEWAAFKLGRRIRELTLQLAADEDVDGAQKASVIHLNSKLHQASLDSATILSSAADGLRGSAAEARLVVLQHELVMELNRNYDVRSPNPDFAGLWSFCESKSQQTKQFFDVTRWPLTTKYQTPPRIAEVQAEAAFRSNVSDEMLKRKRHVIDDDDNADDARFHHHGRQIGRSGTDGDDHKEQWYAGDTLYPFGETVWQKAWLNMKIDRDLQNVKKFSHIYRPGSWLGRIFKRPRLATSTAQGPSVLPPLPAGWQPQNPSVRLHSANMTTKPWYRWWG